MPLCKQLSDTMREIHNEIFEYTVTAKPIETDIPFCECEWHETCRKIISCETICTKCGRVISDAYGADDFIVYFKPETGEVVDWDAYFNDHPEARPKFVKSEPKNETRN